MVKVRTLVAIAPFTGNPLQKRLSAARVVKGFYGFTYTPTRLSANGMNHTFAFPAEAGPHLPTPEEKKVEWI